VRITFGRIASAALLVLACTETSGGVPPCLQADATCVPYAAEIDAARVPTNHRPSGSACPLARGPGSLSATCDYDAGPPLACTHDSDCTMGVNGRCLPAPPVTCDSACSYDECTGDSDCANVPCECRGSATDSAANVCLVGSNCQVDSDCGVDGYCSPSGTAASCSIAYFCHTANDKCTDNVDCPDGTGCNYDPSVAAWACSLTCTEPP
jgi:hypothetical protein